LLTNLQGEVVDSIPAIRIPSDISYGRYPDGSDNWYFFQDPTPGEPNQSPIFGGQVADPEFSHPGGFYLEPFYLILEAEPNAEIRYTLDGSEPDENSPLWPDSLLITHREPSDHLLSYIPTTQPEAEERSFSWIKPAETPHLANILRVRAFRDNDMPSRILTHTFFLDEEVNGGNSDLPTSVSGSHYPIPVISMVTDSLHLFDHETGIYIPGKAYEDGGFNPPWGSPHANYFRRGDAWERPASMEMFDPDQGRVLAMDIGIRIHGGMSRTLPSKSLRLYARSEYGNRRFEYPFFEHPDTHPLYVLRGGPINQEAHTPPSYNRLILRNSGQDFYNRGTMYRDAMIQGLVDHLNFDTQAYRPVVMYINGEYWGILNIRERYDRFYFERTYGIEPGKLDYLSGLMTVSEGSSAHYRAYRDYLVNHDISDSLHYAHINTLLDIDNFLDYNITNIFINNRDWPGNNREFYRYRTEYEPEAPPGKDGRWRYLMIDTDYSFGSLDDIDNNTLATATDPAGTSWPNPAWSTLELRTFLKNPEFRHRFINRFAGLSEHVFFC
jgi:hypothetical protein